MEGYEYVRECDLPSLETFLGVKFGDDCRKYNMHGDILNEDDGSYSVCAQMNEFMNFDTYKINVSYSNKVIGVRLFASVNNSEVDNYVQELLRILEEKYQRLCAKKAEDKWTMTFFDRVHEVDDRQEENLSVVAVIYVYIKRNQHDDSSAVVFLEAYDMLLDKEHRKIRSVLTDAEKEKEYQKAIKAL